MSCLCIWGLVADHNRVIQSHADNPVWTKGKYPENECIEVTREVISLMKIAAIQLVPMVQS